MNKKEVKQVLIELGVPENIANMPAVVDPIYKEYIDKSIDSVRKTNRIIVREDGKISFINMTIEPREDGGVNVLEGDFVTTTNEYGVEVSKESSHFSGAFSKIRREGGKVYAEYGNEKDGDVRKIVALDNGLWYLDGSVRFLLSNKSNYEGKMEEITPAPINMSDYVIDFEYNMNTTLEDYPTLEGYYDTLKAQLLGGLVNDSKALDVEREKNVRLEDEITRVQAELIKKEEKNDELTEGLTKSTEMLTAALAFITKVKNHLIGNVFFGKDAKEFEKKKLELAPGTKKIPEER